MKPSILTDDQRKAALAAGIAIVVMTIAASIANDFTIGKLVVERNATETLNNILALKSGYVPKIFGIILIIAFAGYAIINISDLLFPEFKHVMKIVAWIFLLPMLGEVAMGIWLLIKGIKITKS